VRHHFVGSVRLPEKTGHARRQHAIEPFLGDKAGAEKHDDVGTNGSQPAECLFAIHKRHRKIEQDEIEMARALSK
jgi:hypothetical protein